MGFGSHMIKTMKINNVKNAAQSALSHVDLSDNSALQQRQSFKGQSVCNQPHGECTKLPANFRNPLIQQLQASNANSLKDNHHIKSAICKQQNMYTHHTQQQQQQQQNKLQMF